MKRPVTLFLLMAFLAIQLYFSKVPVTHQVGGSTWIEVAAVPTGMVERAGQYYLLDPHQAFQIHATSAHISAHAMGVQWLEIPQPSGHGAWQMSWAASGLALVGLGGPVYPSPDGQTVIWQDPASASLFESQGMVGALKPIVRSIQQVQKVVWAKDGAATGFLGDGAQGLGVYVLDGDGNVVPALIPQHGAVKSFGFTHEDTVLAALSNGTFEWQGHGAVKAPVVTHATVANGTASFFGVNMHNTVLWHHGKAIIRPNPRLVWRGSAHFSSNGNEVASLATNTQGDVVCYMAGPHRQMMVRLPFDMSAGAQLLGFAGNHWVLITVPRGVHAGTYAWWANNL